MIRKPKKQSNHQPVLIDRIAGCYTSLGYRSARVAASEGRSYLSYPGSTHDERDRKKLIAQSRDFMRNNAIYKGMIERAVSYIVGKGFELQVNTGTTSVDQKIEKFWKDWYKKPEIRNLLSGSSISRMICREAMVAGDVAVLKTNKGLIQIFEAEQIDGKSPFTNGIKKDSFGRPVKFQLCPWKNYGIDSTHSQKVDAINVLYVSNPERPSQIRGVPASQASFPMLHRINDVCDSEAIAWQILSRFAVTINEENGAEQSYISSKEDPNKSSDETEGDLATRVTELDYAVIFRANPGEKIQGIERNIPGQTFSESVKMFLRLLGLPLGIPLEIILLDWTNSNYSQSRAVLEQAFETFIAWQELLKDFYFTPLFEWKLETWLSQGLIGRRNNIQFDWIMPTFPWIDQLKEAQAYATQVEHGFITHNQACKSRNTDRADVITQREREIREAIEKAQKIKKDTGQDVPWEYFAGLKPKKDKSELAKTEKDESEDKED